MIEQNTLTGAAAALAETERASAGTRQRPAGWQTAVYREWDFPQHVLAAWERLALAYGDLGIFLRAGWFKEWWLAMGRTGRLFVAVVEYEDQVKGIFPCWIAPPGRLQALADDFHFDFLLTQDRREQTLDRFLDAVRGEHLPIPASISNFPATSSVAPLLEARLWTQRMPVGRFSGPWSPHLDLRLRTWAEYTAGLRTKLKSNINRRRRLAEKEGTVEFAVIRRPESLEALLTEIFAVEYNSWKGAEGTAIQCSDSTESLYRGAARWGMAEDRLYLFTLRFDGRMVAFDFCLAADNSIFLLKTGYDESFAKFSPGILLRYEALRHLFENTGFEMFDFLGPWYEWKKEWTNTGNTYTSFEIYPPTPAGWIAYFLKYGWKEPLKKSERAVEFARRFRAWRRK
jgi:hypothetical protein